MAEPSFEQQTAEFLSWFKSQPGTTFHHDIAIQDLRSRGAGRGIVATADIPPETVLFTIPRHSIISKDTSSLVTQLPQVFDPPEQDQDMDKDDDDDDDDKSQDSWTTLILILIHEHLQGRASRWAPYLSVLPATFSTPMFWSDQELSELQASPVAAKVGRDEAAQMIRTKILPVVRAHADVFGSAARSSNDDDLVQLAFRMGSAIMAYAFDLEQEDGDEPPEQDDEDEWVEDREGRTTLGMVPMADMLNADAAFNAHIEHGEHALTVTSLRAIKAGEEILNYYGPLSNGELLRRYGYVTVTHRRWNLVDLAWERVLAALKAEISLKDKEWDKVLGSLDEDELEEGFVIDRGAQDPDSQGRVADVVNKAGVPEELLEQLKEVMKAVKRVKPEAVPDKTVRDRVMYSAIAKALEERMGEYPTTLEEDLAAYGDGSIGSESNTDRRRMAVDVRIGEKLLLKQARETVRVKLGELAEAESDGDKPSAKRRKM